MKKKKLEEKQGIPENERSLKRTGEVKITMHPGKKNKPYNKTEHFSKQRDKDSLEKSYFKSGKVHQRAEFPLQFLQ